MLYLDSVYSINPYLASVENMMSS